MLFGDYSKVALSNGWPLQFSVEVEGSSPDYLVKMGVGKLRQQGSSGTPPPSTTAEGKTT